ncbi:MAG: hypothetical protein NVSMB9_26540 [Isosphaeraceae bacterium]
MPRRFVLAWFGMALAVCSTQVKAQVPFARDLVPTRTALARVGLERQWMGVVPLVNEERLLSISLSEDMIFAQTNKANFHVYQAETGQLLWTARLGTQMASAQTASVNSFAVFVTNLNTLFALDRRTGRTIWKMELGTLPSSPAACDEHRVVIGLITGKIFCYGLQEKVGNKFQISTRPPEIWNWQTGGPVKTRPLPALRVVAFGSDDGKVYVSFADERTLLYRIATGGAIGAGLGTFGTRMLLIPSADQNLYSVDLLTAQVLWTFATGGPIQQEPFVADQEIYVVNTTGHLSSIDPSNGSPLWTSSTEGGRLLAIGSKRVYLESNDDDLFIIDRKTGQMVADPRATFERVGLNLRPFELGTTNRQNDRLYFATSSGLLLCIREIGQTRPRLLRDPKAPLFGFIPDEGVPTTPPRPPAAEDDAETTKPKDAPAGDDAEPAKSKDASAADEAEGAAK